MAKAGGVTAAQVRFLGDLVLDVRRVWMVKHEGKGKTERDFVNWLGGVCRRHAKSKDEVKFETVEDVARWCDGLTVNQARLLIGGLVKLHEVLEGGLGREQISTPGHLVRALWTQARKCGYDEEAMGGLVHDVTGGETTSTRQLKKGEAVGLLKRLGGSARVFEVNGNRGG